MKHALSALALSFAGLVGIADKNETVEPSSPQLPQETMIVNSRKREIDIAPGIQGARERKRAEEAGAVLCCV